MPLTMWGKPCIPEGVVWAISLMDARAAITAWRKLAHQIVSRHAGISYDEQLMLWLLERRYRQAKGES